MAPEDGCSNWTLVFQSFDFFFGGVAVTHFPGAGERDNRVSSLQRWKDENGEITRDWRTQKNNSNRVECCPAVGKNK